MGECWMHRRGGLRVPSAHLGTGSGNFKSTSLWSGCPDDVFVCSSVHIFACTRDPLKDDCLTHRRAALQAPSTWSRCRTQALQIDLPRPTGSWPAASVWRRGISSCRDTCTRHIGLGRRWR
eukprot:4956684-Prorocentrum_lima.AAC.1